MQRMYEIKVGNMGESLTIRHDPTRFRGFRLGYLHHDRDEIVAWMDETEARDLLSALVAMIDEIDAARLAGDI